MATNNRDVKMTLSVETLGAEDIKKLQTSVLALAKEAGDAAPEFEKLAAEIGQLGSQADALRSFETLAANVTEAAQAQDLAAAKAAELKTKYDQLQGSTDEARASQEAATKMLRDAQKEYDETVAALKKLKTDTDAAAKAEEGFKKQVKDNIDAQASLKARVRELSDERAKANDVLSKAEAAERRAATAWENSADAAERNQRALAAQQTELKKLGDELDALGLSSQNVVASQVQLKQALDATGRAAQEAAELGRQSAAIDKEATEAKDRLAAAARAQAAAAEESARRRVAAEADVDRAQEEILQRTLAVENRKNEIRERTAELQRQRANKQTADDIALLKQQYAAEEAASDRIVAMKKAAYDRIAALARENAQKTEAAARQSAQALADAFGSIGIRNVQDVNAEIEQVRRSMQLVAQQSGLTGSALAEAMARGNARVNELQREIRELSNQLTLADRAADLFKNSLGQIAAGNLIADAIGSVVEKVKDMGRQFFTANIEIERLTRTMTLVTGSSEKAAEKIAFLRDTANLAGQSVGAVTDSFIRFQASALAAGISSERVDTIFKQVTVSGGKLGLTSEQVSGSLEALSQIAGKGTLSLEELRGQLGDRLPGAVAIAAKGFGYTTDELGKFIKQVESGKVGADEFFQAFIKGLEDFAGSTDEKVGGLLAAYNRLGNAFKQLAQDAQNSQFLKTIEAGMDGLANNLRSVVEGLEIAGKAFLVFATVRAIPAITQVRTAATGAAAAISASMAATAASVAGSVTAIKTAMASLSLSSAGAVAAFTSLRTAATAMWAAITGPVGAAAIAIVSFSKEIGTAIGESVAKMQGYGKAFDELAKSEAEFTRKALESAQKRAAADATQAAADNRAIRAIGDRREAAERNLVLSEKSVKSAEEQAKAIKTLADATDNQSEKIRLNVQASEILVAAKQKELDSSKALVLEMQKEVSAIDRRRDANGKLTPVLEEQFTKQSNLLAQKREMQARTEQELIGLRNEAEARRVVAETYKDNSKRVDELKKKYDEARVAYEQLANSGTTNNAKLAEATGKLVSAEALYKDALKDREALQARIFEQTKDKSVFVDQLRQKYIDAQAAYNAMATSGSADAQKLEEAQKRLNEVQRQYNAALEKSQEKLKLVTDTKLADISISQATLKVALEEARSQEAFARAKGDEKGVRQAIIRQKEIELELTKLEIEAQRLAAEGSIAVAKAKMAELAALNQLTPAKKLELETTIKLAELQVRMADARDRGTQVIQKQIDALRSNKETLDGERGAIDGNTESWSRNIKEREKAAQLAKAAKGEFAYDEQGYRIDAGGQRSMYEVPSEVLKMNWMNNMDMRTGLPVLPWEEWIKKERMGMMPSVKEANANRAAQQAEQQAAQQQKARDQLAGYKPAQTGPFPTLNEVPAPATATRDIPPPRTININFGGRTTAINVASAQDEAALIALLQQLEGAAGRAGG